MKNFIELGDVITITAGATITSGQLVIAGSLFGVAQKSVASGEQVAVKIGGVFEFAKVSAQAWTVGALIYWDATAGNMTTTSTSNTLVGVAAAAAANPSAVGRVRLNAEFR